jgi:hypothetical protein
MLKQPDPQSASIRQTVGDANDFAQDRVEHRHAGFGGAKPRAFVFE